MIQIVALLLIGQVPLPAEHDRTLKRLGELPRSQTVRVYSDALIVDPQGKCWIRGDWVTETATDRYTRHKELEITRSKNGYIVRVLPLWSERDGYYRYPMWQRQVSQPRPGDIPVIAFVVIPKPKPNLLFDITYPPPWPGWTPSAAPRSPGEYGQ